MDALKFQSPMGIGITSNFLGRWTSKHIEMVSIPNGDRHYLERHPDSPQRKTRVGVSIPNGDRHYLERS